MDCRYLERRNNLLPPPYTLSALQILLPLQCTRWYNDTAVALHVGTVAHVQLHRAWVLAWVLAMRTAIVPLVI